MGRFAFTAEFDRKALTEADLDRMFTELSDKIAVTKHQIEQFKQRSVRYRHLRRPPNIFARDILTGKAAIFAPALNLVNVWNWTNVRVTHAQTAVSGKNGVSTGNPVLHLHASYKSHHFEAGAYEIGIGYSVDNGASFTYHPYSSKFLGYNKTHTVPLWTGQTTHYHTGVVTSWWPYSMYALPECHTGIAVRDNGGIPVNTITDWALGIRVNSAKSNGNGTKDIHALDVGKIWLLGRDNT